ncbi:MAG: glycosyltransferase family 2 protein [Pseudomonadota bacterium]
MTNRTVPSLGVVIVTYASADVIEGCLSALFQQTAVSLEIVVIDNASPDGTVEAVQAMSGDVPAPHRIDVFRSGGNRGFAGGVNLGLKVLKARPHLNRFWILNPDAIPEPGCAAALAGHPAAGGFGLMGGRVLYAEAPQNIQIDGGTIDRVTGRTGNLNLGKPRTASPPEASQIDFITGASLVASRTFLEKSGPMEEGYFLYYEEVDWALRRRDLPLLYCADAIVLHKAGTAIGSPTLGRKASAFSLWFKHRARMMFVRRHLPRRLWAARAYGAAKSLQSLLRRDGGAWATFAGTFGLGMPATVRRRLKATTIPEFGGPSRWDQVPDAAMVTSSAGSPSTSPTR